MLAKKAQLKILQSIARVQAESIYYTIIINKNSFYFVKVIIINNKRYQNFYVPVYTYSFLTRKQCLLKSINSTQVNAQKTCLLN